MQSNYTRNWFQPTYWRCPLEDALARIMSLRSKQRIRRRRRRQWKQRRRRRLGGEEGEEMKGWMLSWIKQLWLGLKNRFNLHWVVVGTGWLTGPASPTRRVIRFTGPLTRIRLSRGVQPTGPIWPFRSDEFGSQGAGPETDPAPYWPGVPGRQASWPCKFDSPGRVGLHIKK